MEKIQHQFSRESFQVNLGKKEKKESSGYLVSDCKREVNSVILKVTFKSSV